MTVLLTPVFTNSFKNVGYEIKNGILDKPINIIRQCRQIDHVKDENIFNSIIPSNYYFILNGFCST